MTATIRTRIAPSPTGLDLHIGNAYTALINYAWATKKGGQFIIRVEDTDRTRLVDGSEDRILSSLKWLGIRYAEGPDIGGPYEPYRQSERLPVYRKYADELVEAGHAYYCFCTSERLAEMRKSQESAHLPPKYDGKCRSIDTLDAKKRADSGEKYVIRMKVPQTGTTVFTDLIRGEITFENSLIDDQVLLKTDGFPTYHLGVVIDDHIMGITHIIRGEEWIPSTPKHILLYGFLGWKVPEIAHVSVLRNPDKSKLSKRKNPVWVSDYKAKGYLPEAILNYLASMAWSFPDGRDIFSLDEMISVFEISQLKASAPIFDVEKLRWMNGEYIRNMTNEALTEQIRKFDPGIEIDDDKIMNFLPLVKERMKTLAEFRSLAEFYINGGKPVSMERHVSPALVSTATIALESVKNSWNHDAMEQAIRSEADKAGQKAKDVFMDLRIAITGKSVGPPLLESLEKLDTSGTISYLKEITGKK